MRGRKPTAKTLAMPNDETPTAEVAIPNCPGMLTGEGAREWRRITKLLHSLGIVAHLDRVALALYCQAWADWLDARAKLAIQGPIVKSPSGFPVANPYLSIANGAEKRIQTLLGEFGLSPAARHRLLGAPKKSKATVSKWGNLLAS